MKPSSKTDFIDIRRRKGRFEYTNTKTKTTCPWTKDIWSGGMVLLENPFMRN
jgi:hypothetical protein